jgi:hypothetical protein
MDGCVIDDVKYDFCGNRSLCVVIIARVQEQVKNCINVTCDLL